MFRPIPAIIRFSSERVVVGLMRLCHDGEVSSSVLSINLVTPELFFFKF